MQHQGRSLAARTAYHELLQSDHDYRVWVDILTLEQRPVGRLDLLDGQINYSDGSDGPCRTASVTLSDPEGALNFGTDYLRDPKGVLWINRLIQVWHEITVPGYGDFTTSCIVGLPTTVARSGAEVTLELGDKSLLADHGIRPVTFKKGTNVRSALVSILRDYTGEQFFSIPSTRKTLSKAYTASMGEDTLTPWALFKKIAKQEMSWRGFYDGLGVAVAEPMSTVHNPVPIKSMLALPEASASVNEYANYSRVVSHRSPSNNKKTKIDESKYDYTYDSIVQLKDDAPLSEKSLARNGVGRTMPIVTVNDDIASLAGTLTTATNALTDAAGLDSSHSYEIIPIFHLEYFEQVDLPEGVGAVALSGGASVPLGTGGNMTIGHHKWVSKATRVKKIRSRTTRKTRPK